MSYIKKLDLISSHGQTIYHNPTDEKMLEYSKNSTLQIGELSCIAKLTGVTTVGDFRPCDMALSGQGAPLVPYFDKLIFSKQNKNIALQNKALYTITEIIFQVNKKIKFFSLDFL